MHYVKKHQLIIKQIEDLCEHYSFSKEVKASIKEIAYNALRKGVFIVNQGLKVPRSISNV